MVATSWPRWRHGSVWACRPKSWGRHKIDFSVLPPALIDLFRTGTDLEISWLTTLAERTKKFKAKIPS